MAIFWNSVAHVFASGFHDLVVGARAIASVTPKIESQASAIEEITSLVPVYGAEAEIVERIAFACLGEFAALVNASGGSAAKALSAVPNADPQLLSQVEALLQKNPQMVSKVAALYGVKITSPA